MDSDEQEQLWHAAEIGDVETVKQLLLHPQATLDLYRHGDTVLHISSRSGNVAVVKVLLEHNADINEPNSDGRTALALAVEGGHSDIVRVLVEHGADVNIGDEFGVGPLHIASGNGKLEIVSALLDGSPLVDLEDGEGNTPLMSALYKSHTQVARLLVESGANIKGIMPIAIACDRGDVELVKLLLERYPRPDRLDNNGFTPLVKACLYGNMKLVELLIEKGASIDLEATGRMGSLCQTPLGNAAQFGHLEVVKYLLEKGANVNLATINGRTPLSQAAQKGNLALIQLLLDSGANVEGGESLLNESPLRVASQAGHVAVVKLLLERGAKVDVEDRDGYTPLFAAAKSGHLEVVNMLLDYGANANRKCINSTPIAAAVRRFKYDLVVALAERGATIAAEECVDLFELCLDRFEQCQQIAAFILRNCPQVAKSCPRAIVRASGVVSNEVFMLLIENGVKIDYSGGQALRTALHSKQAFKVWQLVLHGANTNIRYEDSPTSKSIWECVDDPVLREALLHFWTPQSHKLHPRWVRDGIISALLVAKKQEWPFDQQLMHRILSFVAYGWYKR